MATKNLNLAIIDPNDLVSVDPINTNFTEIDANNADSIIERGDANGWWYRKYRNGRYECGIEFKWFDRSNLLNIGDVYGISKEYNFGSYPITFVGRPYVNITFQDENGGKYAHCYGWIAMDKQISYRNSPNFKVVIDRGKAPIKPACGIHVIGRWK